MRTTLPALAITLALAVWAMLPALATPESTLIGNWMHPDCISNHWLLTWVADQLAQGQGILHNDTYYWPVGDAPVLAGNGAEGVTYLPFHLAFGWPAGAAFYLTAILILNGMGGWALGRSVGAGPLPALLPAAAATVSPYLMGEISAGRFTQVSIGWMLLCLASWIRLLDHPSQSRAIVSGLLWAVTGFFYWYHAWFLALGLMGLLLAKRLAHASIPWRSVLLGAGTAALLISPWAILFLSAWSEIPGTIESFPPPMAAQDSVWPAVPFIGPAHGQVGVMSALVWLFGLVGACAALMRGDHLGRWALCTWLVFTVLAMGPFASWAPYSLLYDLAPPLRRFWWPLRHIALAGVLWAALGAVWLTRYRWGRGVALGVAITAPGLLAVQGGDHQITVTSLALPSPGMEAIAELPDGIVLQPPLAPQAAGTQLPLLFQMQHKKTLLSGHAPWVDRVRPPAWDSMTRNNSFLSALMAMERGESDETLQFEPEHLSELLDQGLRWLVLDRSTFPFGLQSAVRAHRAAATALFGQPVVRAKGLRVWDMASWSGESRVVVPAVRWPADLIFAGPQRPLTARRPHPPLIVLEIPQE